MKNAQFLIVVLLCGLCACKKSTLSPKDMLVSEWNLRQQHSIINFNGIKTNDTTIYESANDVSNVNFNSYSTFTSENDYGPLTDPAKFDDYLIGAYSFNNDVIILQQPVEGFEWPTFSINPPGIVISSGGAPAFLVHGGPNGPPPIPSQSIDLISNSAKIIQLTSTLFTLQTEYIYTVTGGAAPGNYDYLTTYYFTKEG